MARVFAVLAIMLVLASPSLAGDDYIDEYIEILRTDARAEKRAVISAAMNLSDAQAKKFWPVYNKYEADVKKLNNKRINVIKDYAEHYWSMSDGRANDLMTRALDFQMKRVYLRKDYYRKFSYAVGHATAAKFMQIDNQIGLLVDLQIAANLPILD